MNKKELIEHNEEEFTIISTVEQGNLLGVWINFPNCPYGNKIMVFEGIQTSEIYKLERINPHFESEGITPIARFNPHYNGWDMAIAFVTEHHNIS